MTVKQEDEGAPQGDQTRQEQAESCMVLSTSVYDPERILHMAILKASTGAKLRLPFHHDALLASVFSVKSSCLI